MNADAVAAATLTYAKSTRSLGVGDANRFVARALTADQRVNHNADYEVAAS